jgi:hypothetical protein
MKARFVHVARRRARSGYRRRGDPAGRGRHSVVTWGANADRQGAGPVDRSYRMIVRTSVGGTDMRIRLTNTFGDHPVTFASVYAGLQKQGAELVHGSNRQLAFGGQPLITVPAGETVLSDPLPGRLAARSQSGHQPVCHRRPGTDDRSRHGHADVLRGPRQPRRRGGRQQLDRPDGSWYWLDAVSVDTSTAVSSVVTLGDSITDGWVSTSDANRR